MTGKEIERKWLIKAPPELALSPPKLIEQGYLQTKGEVRLRREYEGQFHFMMRKSGTGLVRTEEMISISKELFDDLWPMTEGRRVIKNRYTWRRLGQPDMEIDEFLDQDLWLAEVEFSDEDTAHEFIAPSFCHTDVTEDPAYKNANLAK